MASIMGGFFIYPYSRMASIIGRIDDSPFAKHSILGMPNLTNVTPPVEPPVEPPIEPPVVGALDAAGTFTGNTVCAYSLRNLFSSYTGAHIEIVRSTGGTYDLWFDNNYNVVKVRLDTVDIVFTVSSTFEMWVGGATIYVSKLYDQSGNGKHATAIVEGGATLPTLLIASSPYSIYLNGSTETVGSYFDMGNTVWDNINQSGFASFTHFNLKSAQVGERIYDFGNSGTTVGRFLLARNLTNQELRTHATNGETFIHSTPFAYTDDTWANVIVRYSKTNETQHTHTVRSNGSEVVNLILPSLTNRTSLYNWIGKAASGIYPDANMEFREMIFFNRDVSDTETITGWENSIPVEPPVVVPLVGALDAAGTFTGNTVCAYSLRNLFSSYTGAHIEIVRSDGVETYDVWFDENYNVVKVRDTVDIVFTVSNTFQTWVGGATIYVTKLYDQSGNGKHATAISVGGATLPTLLIASLPYSIYLNGSASTTVGSYYDIGTTSWDNINGSGFVSFTSFNIKNADLWERIYDFGNGAGNANLVLSRQAELQSLWVDLYNGTTFISNSSLSYTNNTWANVINRYSKTNTTQHTHSIRINKAEASSNLVTSPTNRTLTNNWIGRTNWAGFPFANMEIREMIFFNRDVSDTPTLTGWENSLPALTTPVENPVFVEYNSITPNADWPTNSGFIASVSSYYGNLPEYAAWKAFDKISTTHWVTFDLSYKTDGTPQTTAQWIQIQYPQSYYVRAFSIIFNQKNTQWQYPTSWILQGSNDNSNFENVQSYTQTSWFNNQKYTFNVTAELSFKYWRVLFNTVSVNASSARHLGIQDITFSTSTIA